MLRQSTPPQRSNSSSTWASVNLSLTKSLPTRAAPSSPSMSKLGKFSFDGFLRKMRHKSHSEPTLDPHTAVKESSLELGTDKDMEQKTQTAPKPKPIRPPPIHTSPNATPPAMSSTIRLCQSPGGRSNVSLAIPVTPPTVSCKHKNQQIPAAARHRPSQPQGMAHDADEELLGTAVLSPDRSSFAFGPWRESVILSPTSLTSVLYKSAVTSPISHAKIHRKSSSLQKRASTLPRESSIDDFLSSFPRDLVPDVRTICSPSSFRQARYYMRYMLQIHLFEIRASKWAAYFLQLVRMAKTSLYITRGDCISLQWSICAYVRHEAETRNRVKEAQEKQFQKKMTDYRVAMQCICGTSVLKYGRKGKPHQTHFMIENGDTFRWTSKRITGAVGPKKKNKCILLASIIDIRTGPTTDVLIKALQKGTLQLQDAKCTLSLITETRTFDIKARSAAEREWLVTSFRFLVELAQEHEKQVAQQVELSIMKRMEASSVWKHGRKGRPHKTRVLINRFGEISWQGRSNDTIQLDEITSIVVGHETPVFQRSRKNGLTTSSASHRCFSLITATRTLDIEAMNEQQRDWYVVAFRYLIDKVHEKTAALKREKAQKQLKLLQELCGGSMSQLSNGSGLGSALSLARVA